MNAAMLIRPMTHLGIKLMFALKQHAPELLVSSGVIGFGLSLYGAIKGTIKAVDILEERDEMNAAIDECVNNQDISYSTDKEEKDRKDLRIKTTWRLARAYLPAATMFLISIVLVLAGFRILHIRNVGLAAAYKALEKTYERREQYIKDKYGPDAFDEEPPGVIEDPKKLEKAKAEYRERYINRNKYSILFDEFVDRWREDPGLNVFAIQSTENYVTNHLIRNEPVLLLDVTRILGIPDDRAIKELHANIVGWDPSDPECDMRGDFGLSDPINREFLEGRDCVAVLTFNVDGPVYNEVWKRKYGTTRDTRGVCA